MPTNVVVPELGESVLEATVARWHKQAGEPVATGDVVVELETDKVNLDVVAPKDGVLARIQHVEGEDVEVGDVLAVIEEAAEAAEPPDQATSDETSHTGKQEETPAVEKDQGPTAAAKTTAREPEQDAAAERETPEKITPVARRLAEEQDVDLSGVTGRGPGGRITRQDVERYLAKQTEPSRPTDDDSQRETAAAALPVNAGETRREERQRMSRRRRTIARRLVEAQQTAAMLTTFNDVDMSQVMAVRGRHKESFQARHDVKLGITSFFVKAAVGALKAFPLLNAEVQDDEIVIKHYYDIGVAIGASEGLVVPVLRDAGRMSFAEIERGIKEFAQKAKEGTLSLQDLRGGTFTITNGGVFGSLLSTPILNPPQVGILGLHRIEERPCAVNRQVVVRPMMYLALSYDHRIVDGREAVQFLVHIKRLIEDPETLLLEG